MTMVHKPRHQTNRLAQVAGAVWAVAAMLCGSTGTLSAVEPPVHYLNAGIMPPGAIGTQQLMRGGPLAGYFQPVEIKVPQGALISTVLEGGFDQPERGSTKAGMLIGAVYRLKVTNIPQNEGLEVYPTIEVIDRLYPPLGQETRFPIPVDLTREELEMAISGKFVTRVIYLEEPNAALPVAEDPLQQSYFEAATGENPLDVADRLGRPVAILRMGGRLPEADGPDAMFLFGSPPLVKYRTCEPFEVIDPNQGLEANRVRPLPRTAQGVKPAKANGPAQRLGAASSSRKPIWRGQSGR